MDGADSGSPSLRSEIHTIHFLLWNEFIHIIHLLSQGIQADGIPEIIIGLQRGGLIPAVCFSHHLGVRQFFSLPVSRTASDAAFADKTTPSIIQMQPGLFRQYITNQDVLVVDDIAGTGESMKEVLHLLASFAPLRIRSAICVVNRENWDAHNPQAPTQIITYVGKEVYGWVVFPWEMQHVMCLNTSSLSVKSASSTVGYQDES